MKTVYPKFNDDYMRTEFHTSYSPFGKLYMICPLSQCTDVESEDARCHDHCAWINIEYESGNPKEGSLFCKDIKIANYVDNRVEED